MTSSLHDWPRPHFKHPGGKPFLYFVVYGKFGKMPGLSASHYRSTGIPTGMDLSHYQADQHPDVLAGFREGYLWTSLCSRNPELAKQVADSKECMILRGEIDDDDSLNYLRDSVGLLTCLLDHGGVTIYDPSMFHWWEPETWRQRIFDPAGPVPRHHVVILTSQESDSDLTWFHTRGMRKFGRPDLSIHNVPPPYNAAVIELCERFIELQAFGGIIEEEQEIKMKSLPHVMTCHHNGNLDDPDFNNVHVEIVWRKSERQRVQP
jgi:hypothetical protein